MHVYVDESGDLGFTPKSTQFFVVAYLIVELKRILKEEWVNKRYSYKLI